MERSRFSCVEFNSSIHISLGILVWISQLLEWKSISHAHTHTMKDYGCEHTVWSTIPMQRRCNGTRERAKEYEREREKDAVKSRYSPFFHSSVCSAAAFIHSLFGNFFLSLKYYLLDSFLFSHFLFLATFFHYLHNAIRFVFLHEIHYKQWPQRTWQIKSNAIVSISGHQFPLHIQ